MKRFFCTICNSVKRVRTLPIDTVESDKPSSRTGLCRYHFDDASRTDVNGRVRVIKSIPSRKAAATPAAPKVKKASSKAPKTR